MEPETLSLIQDVVTAVVWPFFAFNHPDSDYYWPYLLSTLALAFAVYLAGGRWRGEGLLAGFRRAYFSRRVWGHPSALADYRFYIVNAILFTALFAPLILSGAWLARETAALLDGLLGAPAPPLEAGAGVKLAHTVVFFLCYDFGRWSAHYLLHRIGVLWEFHKVHHSAEVLTPITNARAHPVELVLMASVPAALTGLASGAFMHLYAREVGVYTYLSLHVFVFVFSLYGNLRHSHVWLSFGPRLSRLLVSPAQHQIHHSAEPRHWGRNLGFTLALWDWWFGTLYVPEREETFRLGLDDASEPRYHGVLAMYLEPFRTLAARYRRAGEKSRLS